VHGSEGRLMAGNHTGTTVEVANAKAVSVDKPLFFFLERYAAAYKAELAAFLACLKSGKKMPVGAVDGREALVLAEAALQSHRTGKRIKIRGR
jgi:myo-inositol 2-dehydrogenase/D-chiro-inositol 1-dehydrogenase